MKITEFLEFYKDIFPVGEGWRDLVTKLVNDIMAIDKTVEITQVKEKFGELRFYVSSSSEQVFNLIEQAEAESLKICEICGIRENVTTQGAWLLTLCSKCRKEHKNDN